MNGHFLTRSACPCCGAAGNRTLFSRPYSDSGLRHALEAFYAAVGRLEYDSLLGAEYVVQKCDECRLLFQRDVPNDALLATLYEEWISPQKAFARYHAHVSDERRAELLRNARLTLALQPTAATRVRALDYGCGWGEWARTMKELGAESWGTELSPSRREACVRQGITLATDEELPDGSFDVINADQVFEHLPTPSATLGLLRRKLRPSGVIRIAVPNGWSVENALASFDREIARPRLGRLNPIAPLEHLNAFTAENLIGMATRCGLRRTRPRWATLLRTATQPRTLRGAAKQLTLPFYLRSRWTTQLWFTATERSATT